MTEGMRLGTKLALACAIALVSKTGHAATSIWAARVGKILPTDQTAWCEFSATSVNGQYTVTANLREVNTDGSLAQSGNYMDSATTINARMQCLNNGVPGAPIQSGFVSSNAVVQCPAGQAGVYLKCMINTTDGDPFVYDGNQGGDPCGNGVSGISLPPGLGFQGQITGQSPVLEYSNVSNALFNGSNMASAQVIGTDMGYMFYATGKLWAGYGDTWANALWTPVAPTNKRGSVLFSTSDLNASDGLQFDSWVGSPTFASEIVPSCHDASPCSLQPNEVSAIADAGFVLHENNMSYKVLWFLSINTWGPSNALNQSTFNGSSLAWSTGSGFTRGDLALGPTGKPPPRWGSTSSFGAGAVWQDRLNGLIYFFGQQPYQNNAPIRLARVAAKVASVFDATQYTYWDGVHSRWSSSEADATPVIQGSANAGPEFSVAFNAYANQYLMMFVSNRWNVGGTAAVQLWEATNLNGPWTQIPTSPLLPNATWGLGIYAGQYWYFYGPEMSEQLMTGGGQTVYYQLSEWNGTPPAVGGIPLPYPAGLPYNTGLWTYSVSRNVVSGCQQ
jgi:hypothetical protein